MFRRLVASSLAGALLLGATVLPSPASAQRASDCGQLANLPGSPTFTYTDSNKSGSAQVLAGVVNAAIQNVIDDVNVLNASNIGANVSVVCVTDSLNNNHLEILKNINVDVIDDVTVNGVSILNDVNVLAFDGGTLFVAPADLQIGD